MRFSSNYDSGISFKDEELSIELNIKDEDLIISDKDLSLPKISELKKQEVYENSCNWRFGLYWNKFNKLSENHKV